MKPKRLRKQLIETARALVCKGLCTGTSGNVSVRFEDGFLITPSGMDYDQLLSQDVVFIAADGNMEGTRKPSSEWRVHRDIYAERPDIHAIVHTHSTFATALACLRKSIPAFHYMVAVAGGHDIRCSGYATFGTQKLSNHTLKAMRDRKACLLGNHGQLATGADLDGALALAEEVEDLARKYHVALSIGSPKILSRQEMDRVLDKFKAYGSNAQKAGKGD